MKEDAYGKVHPKDQYNKILVDNVYPPEWENPRSAGRYNLVVIGAGTAGLVCAAGAAGLGAKVALIEKHLLGGDCLNMGCVPSKAILRSSRAAAEIHMAGRFGVRLNGDSEVDFSAVMERMRRLRSRISHNDSARRFKGLGVDVYLGAGRFTGEDWIEVGGEQLNFSRAVIATGARAVELPIEGLAAAEYLTNETVFSLTERPNRLAVIGGGPIGCEMAQAFRRLGSDVTLFQMTDHLLDREDMDAADILQTAFLREGIRLLLKSKPEKVEVTGEGKVITFEHAGKSEKVVVDQILLGVGRAPNVEGLDLEVAGVDYDKHRGVFVNDHLQTSNRRIYAAGDICLQYKFTHTADVSARIVIQNALFLGHKKLSALTIPWVTYTDPEIAHVGLYERDAEEMGIAVDTLTKPLGAVDRATLDGEEEGFVRIHLKKGTDKILGATVVARHAGEMINEISLAMVGKLGLKTIAAVIHPYPTQAEAIKHLADEYNRSRLTPFLRSIFITWLSLRRTDFMGRLEDYAACGKSYIRKSYSLVKGKLRQILRGN